MRSSTSAASQSQARIARGRGRLAMRYMWMLCLPSLMEALVVRTWNPPKNGFFLASPYWISLEILLL